MKKPIEIVISGEWRHFERPWDAGTYEGRKCYVHSDSGWWTNVAGEDDQTYSDNENDAAEWECGRAFNQMNEHNDEANDALQMHIIRDPVIERRIPPELMSLERDQLINRMFLIQNADLDTEGYWGPNYSGYRDVWNAAPYTYEQLEQRDLFHGASWVFCLLAAPGTTPVPPAPLTKPITLTANEAAFRTDLGEKPCLLMLRDGRYVNTQRNYTSNRFEADMFTVKTAISAIDEQGWSISEFRLYVFPPVPEGKKSVMEWVLPKSLLELVRQYPANPAFRAQVHAIAMIPIPDEHQTFESIKEWFDTTVDMVPKKPDAPFQLEPDPVPATPTPQVVTTTDRTVLTMQISCDEVEYGRARYSVTVSGSGSDEVTEREVMDLVRDSEDVDELMSAFDERARETAQELPRDDYGDYEYEEHEATDNDYLDSSWDNRNSFRRNLEQFLRDNYPEEWARLNGEELPEEDEPEHETERE